MHAPFVRAPRRTVSALLALFAVFGTLLAGPGQTAMATGGSTRAELIKACYDPVQNRGPNPAPDSQYWCQPVFSELSVNSLDGGALVAWKASSTWVQWYCGPGGTLTACPITGIRVEAYYVVDGSVRGRGRCATSLESGQCIVGGLEPGVRYKVEVYVDLANGNWLRVNSAVTPCCAAPAPPVDVVASPSAGSLDVSWGQSPDWGGAEELTYRVTTTPETSTCTVKVLACRLENVPRGVPLTVMVTATNSAGTSAASSSPSVVAPLTAPDPPSVVVAKYPGPGTARITWNLPTNDGGKPISRYVVTAAPGGKTCSTSAARACSIGGLAGGKAYTFTVRALNSVGTSGPSPAGVAGVLVNPASRPREVQARLSGNAAVVSWQAPASNGGGRLVSYVVRSIPDAGTCTTKQRSCTIRNLALGVSYRFTVVAVNTSGRGLPGETGTVTVPVPVATPPTAPPPGKPTQELT